MNTNLKENLADLFHQDPKKDTVLIISDDPNQTVAVRRLVQSTLPNLKMVEADSTEMAMEYLRGKTREHVAMIIALDGGKVKNATIKSDLIPITLIANEEMPSPWKASDVEAKTTAPLGLGEFAATLAESINKRRGLFGEMEKEARVEVLEELTDYYLSLAKVWMDTVRPFIEANDLDYQAEIQVIVEVVENFIKMLENLQPRVSTITDSELRKVVHDLKNGLSSVIILPDFIKDSVNLSDVQVQYLKLMKNEASQMNNHLQMISQAYQSLMSWQKIKLSKPTMQTEEKLEFPEGTSFCVIDDNKAVLAVTKKTIETAGGKAMTVDSKESLEEMIEAGGEIVRTGGKRPEIKVFLLDNDLGNGVFGYELIALIRSKYPRALIIAHTGDAVSLNADHNNPYRELGVEVVGKREWHAVSGVLKKMLPKTPSGAVEVGTDDLAS